MAKLISKDYLTRQFYNYNNIVNDKISTSKESSDESLAEHVNNTSNPHEVTKSQVGLGNVANIDQSKAIKSIIRDGLTFTVTTLDNNTTTFTQQDTTYSEATTETAGLMSITDKKKLDGIAEGATKVEIDVELSSTSENPVQNKIINEALAKKLDIAQGSTNAKKVAITDEDGNITFAELATDDEVNTEFDSATSDSSS